MPAISAKADNITDNLKNYFSWFDDTFSGAIKENCEKLWQFTPEIRLFSLEKNSKNFFIGNDYFVTQVQLNNLEYFLRLSEDACNLFLTKSLGENGKKFFDLSDLTSLEVSIISKFNNDIISSLKDNFISKKEIQKLFDREEDFSDVINLGFIIKQDDFEVGKLFLTIPEKAIKFPEEPTFIGKVDTTKFKKALAVVDIFLGKTKLSLEEINNIEADDIVVLEDSNIKKMAITSPTKIDFSVNPDPRLFIKEDKSNTDMEDIEVSTKDIWDNVQVDVCAKFPKVKMSLGELREMAEGVVMELDSVYGNEVVLEVENKNVAKGELVIVGSKYGVKITEIYEQPESDENIAPQVENAANAEVQEDFDVKDFEIEE